MVRDVLPDLSEQVVLVTGADEASEGRLQCI